MGDIPAAPPRPTREEFVAATATLKAAMEAVHTCPIEDRAQLRALFERVEEAAEAQGALFTRRGSDGLLWAQAFCTKSLLDLRMRDVLDLRARVAALEQAQQQMKYRGVWQPAETYEKGNFATYDGSLWACIADAPGKPGVHGWQLAAKKGRDGADAREHA